MGPSKISTMCIDTTAVRRGSPSGQLNCSWRQADSHQSQTDLHKKLPTLFDKQCTMNVTFCWTTTRYQEHNVRREKPQVSADEAQSGMTWWRYGDVVDVPYTMKLNSFCFPDKSDSKLTMLNICVHNLSHPTAEEARSKSQTCWQCMEHIKMSLKVKWRSRCLCR